MNTSEVAPPSRASTDEAEPDRRLGRPFDRSRDAEILSATVDELAERDYEQVSLDAVASRSGRAKTTLYRRWPTKAALVLAAVHAIGRPPETDALPDRGSLRADLLAVTDSSWLGGPERRLAVFAGLASAAKSSAPLAEAVRTEVTEPYVEVYRRLLRRALERGQIPAGLGDRIDLLAQVVPAMSSHWLGTSRRPVSRDLYVSVIDGVVLPALRP